jgi:hypothetical protein
LNVLFIIPLFAAVGVYENYPAFYYAANASLKNRLSGND